MMKNTSKNLYLLPSFGTINIQKYIFCDILKNTGQMQYRKNMTKIYQKYT